MRGVDSFRDDGVTPNSVSSVELHENYWRWREEYPAEPYWVHFQTTDVHHPHTPVTPFEGLFISAARRRAVEEWERRLRPNQGGWDVRAAADFFASAFGRTGIDRVAYFTGQRDLHDETMAHQDDQLGKLVARLKAKGEWEHTLLIVAADHGVAASSWDYGVVMQDSLPPGVWYADRKTPMLRPGVSRIPLIVVWPGHIPCRAALQPSGLDDRRAADHPRACGSASA